MARFRKSTMALHPINRIKHVVDSQFGATAGSTTTLNLIVAVDAPVIANTAEVITGSKVNGLYLHVEVVGTSSVALSNVYMMVNKNPGNNLSMPTPNTVGVDDNKKFVIHQEMIMLQQQDNSNPRTLFNGVIVIPKGYRRFGPADRLQLRILAPGVNINACAQAHYKEFR